MSDAFIRTEDLCFSYESEGGTAKQAVKNVSLEIGEGEFVAILGHNGSGKSTFAKLLNMILTPTSGKIFIGGREITSSDFSENDMFDIRRSIGMVFQNPDNQIVATVVEEDVAFGPENLGIEPAEIRRRVDEALETVGMTEYAKYVPHKLSGGQKQRIAIAGIIAMRPKCIIFDESTAMLDPLGREELMSTIDKLNREEGITVILITHYMNEAARADRVIVFNDGEVFTDGTPREVFSCPGPLRAVGLDVPQTVELLEKLNSRGWHFDQGLIGTEECAKAVADVYCKMCSGGQDAGETPFEGQV